MLDEEPMHPYRMQQLIKERHKDDVVNVSQRNSVYQTIERLLREDLIEVATTERRENRPERTTYRITDAGRAILREWLYAMVSTPAREYPEFPAALAFLPNLGQAEAIEALAARAERLAERLAALDGELADGGTFLPRIFLVESEYQREVVASELAYVRRLVDDLRTDRIAWP
ncbi:PadR family transcriptional regulator [Planosporangium mesophilum]|nr:PadR family transcriptional regulator [Planosporangium mesophilum]NJC86572.1 PadR family transcriptional regulator [Planosporangium mesophilum]